jgi:DNA-binding PadR family transcriptional regulator
VSLVPILLALIADEPSSGYGLKRRIDDELSPLWTAELSQIYPALERLRRAGYVSGRVVGPSRGPASYRYRVTAAGRRELARWIAEPPRAPSLRDETLARLVLAGALGFPDPDALAAYDRALAEEASRLRRRTGSPLAQASRDAALARLEGIRRWARARESGPSRGRGVATSPSSPARPPSPRGRRRGSRGPVRKTK